MHVTVPSLIGRLRRRLHAMAWLLALVMVAKGALASLCIGDGVGGSERAVVSATDVAAAHADDGAACWHAGSGGCHCTCGHASALLTDATSPAAVAISVSRVSALVAGPRDVPLPDALRPPIA